MRQLGRKGARTVRLLTVLVGLTGTLLATAVPAQAQITIAGKGAPGTLAWYVSTPVVKCMGEKNTTGIGLDGLPTGYPVVKVADRSFGGGWAYINRSPLYPNSQQTLWTRHAVQYWSGTGWVNWRDSGYMKALANPGGRFYSQGFEIPIYGGGWSWRLVSDYVWSAGNVWLGSATNLYSASEYGTSGYVENDWTYTYSRVTTGVFQGSGYCNIA